MARLIGRLNEGSLLRRTLLYIGTFVLGSVTFVALMSVLLVSIAKAVLPSHTTEPTESKDKDSEAAAEEGAVPSKPFSVKPPKTKRNRPAQPPAEGEPSPD